MQKFFIYLAILFLFSACSSSDDIFELSSQQSMCMIGKGPGQDAAINPYSNSKSVAVIKNLGPNSFEARIQKNGTFIQSIAINPKEKKEIILEEKSELYLDSESASKARVKFREYNSL